MYQCRRCGKKWEGGSGCICYTLCKECGEKVKKELQNVKVEGLRK